MPQLDSSQLAGDLSLARALLAEADLISRDRYRSANLQVEHKADTSLVTDADTGIENMLRARLSAARPHDAVLGEEQGQTGKSNRLWVIDPIDGTSNFARGVPIWGTLIALLVDNIPVVGAVSAPVWNKSWWAATGQGSWMQEGNFAPRKNQVSKIATLAEATISYNNLHSWDSAGHLDQLITLTRKVGRTRAFGDLWSYMLLVEGAIDIVGEFDMKLWDIAALVPIIREAGGSITAPDGNEYVPGPGVIASNTLLHESVVNHIHTNPQK